VNNHLNKVLNLIKDSDQKERHALLRKNRRRHVRVAVATEFAFQLQEFRGRDLSYMEGHASGTTHNLSLSGLAFETHLDLPPGMVIGISFREQPWSELPRLEVQVLRSVERHGRHILAGEFCELYGEARERMHTLLLSRLRAQKRESE
jgi:hypothetical protein